MMATEAQRRKYLVMVMMVVVTAVMMVTSAVLIQGAPLGHVVQPSPFGTAY